MARDLFDDEGELVRACLRKDLAAWSFFIKRYSRLISVSIEVRLKKYGLRLPSQDIEDLRQTVLSSIWQEEKLRSVRNHRSISYWLAIVSGNTALELMRKRHADKVPETISLSGRIGEEGLAEALHAAVPKPPDAMHAKEIVKKVEDAVESLSGKEKIIAKMNIVYDMKYREIADCLKIPRGTVSSYIKRVKEKLRKALKDL